MCKLKIYKSIAMYKMRSFSGNSEGGVSEYDKNKIRNI